MAEQKFQDLTIKNNFMFGAVMAQPENCKGVIELVLGMKIDHVEVSKEKSMVYHPEYKGVRLDVYAKDENIQDITLKCRWQKSRPWESGPVIIRDRWIWNCF